MRSRVAATFGRENVKILGTNFTIELFVGLSNVLFKLVELKEWINGTLGTSVFQQMVKGFLNVQIGKSDAVLFFV